MSSPSVVGNLWDVTSKDIDKFSTALISSWKDDGKHLSQIVSESRKVCSMKYIGIITIYSLRFIYVI